MAVLANIVTREELRNRIAQQSLKSRCNRVIDASFPPSRKILWRKLVRLSVSLLCSQSLPRCLNVETKRPVTFSLSLSFSFPLINATSHIAAISVFEDAFSRYLRNFHFHARHVPVYISVYFESTAITVSQRASPPSPPCFTRARTELLRLFFVSSAPSFFLSFFLPTQLLCQLFANGGTLFFTIGNLLFLLVLCFLYCFSFSRHPRLTFHGT